MKKNSDCAGLTVSLNPKITEYNVFGAVWYAMLSTLFSFGFVMAVSEISGTEFMALVTAVTAVFLSFSIFFIRLVNKISRAYFILPLFFVLLLSVTFNEDINKGFASVYNGFIKCLSCSDGNVFLKLYAENVSAFSVTIFFELVCAAVCIIISLSIITGDVFVPLLMLLCITVFGIYTGVTSAPGIVFMMTSAFVLTLKLLTATKSEYENKYSLSVKLIIMIPLFLTLCAGTFAFNSCENNFASQIKEGIVKKTEALRYGGSNALPEGDFSKINRLSSDGKEMLRVVMNKPQSYYLRGFVGGDYSEKGWKSREYKKIYDYSDMFYVLHQNNFYGQGQISLLCSNLYGVFGDNRIIVKNTGGCRKYLYAPYEADFQKSSLFDNNSLNDCGILSDGFFGEKNYTYFAYDNKVKNYSSLENELYTENYKDKYSDYMNSEKHYRDFVYKNYLDIPENTRNVLKSVLGSYQENERIPYGTAKRNILNVLYTAEYSEEANYLYDGKKDIISEFLQETKKGNSVHFASAAALMLRYYGIPSRYAEGYAITPDDTERLRSNTEIIITDSHAHMWAEYYCDGIGWLPFEAVPQYMGIMQDDNPEDGFSSYKSSSEKNGSSSEKSKSDSKNTEDTENSYAQPEIKINTFLNVVCVIILSALMLLILYIIFILNKKRAALSKKLQGFENRDNNIAAVSLFLYSVDLLKITGVIENYDNIYFTENQCVKELTEAYGDMYTKAYRVFLKARFSKHKISDDEKHYVELFKNEAVTRIKNSRNRLQLIKDKYVSFLYI